jgi:chromosome segregation ATPase
MGIFTNPSLKVKYFRHRLRQSEYAIFDAEFHLEKLKQIREQIRVEYDRLNEQVIIAQKKLDEEKSKKERNVDVMGNIEKFLAEKGADLDQFKAQLAGIDAEINDDHTPKGALARLSAARAMREMLSSHLKKVEGGDL